MLRAAQDLGVSVPGEVRVTGFDDVELAAYVEPALTSIEQPTARMAEEVLRLLALRQQDRSAPGSRVALAPRLVARASTAA